VGDIFTSLIHSCALNGEQPFEHMVEVLRHHEKAAEAPAEWMPWNYREALSRPQAE